MIRIVFIAMLFSATGMAQLSLEVDRYKADHPNAHSVQLAQEKVIKIDIVDGELQIIEEYYEEDLYLNANATYASKRSLTFSTFFEMVDIEAYTLVPENGGYRKYKVEDFREKDEIDESFHDDNKSINFIYPNLNAGGKTVLKYTQLVRNPRFLNPFYFGSTSPIVKSKLTIIADKEVSLTFRQFNVEDIPVTYSTTEKGRKVIHKWESINTEEYEFEDNAPSFKNTVPHLIPIVVSYPSDKGEVKILEDVSDLYRWYYSLVKDINTDEPDEKLVQLVHSLTSSKNNDLDKVKALYYWTQQNIKYIAFEYALGGFIPREANEVFIKKYGDCKDNTSILYKMLEIAGLKGNITWIGTRAIPYSYEEVPTPLVDNHMILSYEYEGRTYFLDATGRYNSIEFPTSFIQGKEALVSLGNDGFRLEEVPIIPSNLNRLSDESNVSIKDDIIIGRSSTEVSGLKKIDFFYSLEEELSDRKIDEWYRRNLQKGNNTFLVKDVVETNKYSYDDNLKVDYGFEIANYVRTIGDEMYVNLNLNKNLLDYKTGKNRLTPIEYDYQESCLYRTTLTIPEGYEVEYLPENIEVSNASMTAKIAYTVKEGLILYEHSIAINDLQFDLEEQAEMNALIKKVEKAYNEVVVLKKPK